MKLCEHIVPIYQNEIKKGNEPLLVIVPSPDDMYASIRLGVLFKKPLGKYLFPLIEETTRFSVHFPNERYFLCQVCKCMISGPIEENQKQGRYERSTFDSPRKEVVAAKDNVYVDDGFYEKFVIPIDKWKEER